jgi:toxin HigB-1
MIRSFKQNKLEKFFKTGLKTGINPKHVKQLRLILFKLDTATEIQDMSWPWSNLQPLRKNRKNYWTINVDDDAKVTFQFEDKNVYNVDYIDK